MLMYTKMEKLVLFNVLEPARAGSFFCLILHIKFKGVDGNADDIKPRYKKIHPKSFRRRINCNSTAACNERKILSKICRFRASRRDDYRCTAAYKSPSSDNKTSDATYVTYQYKYGSSNASKTYTATRSEFFKFGKEKDKKVVVKINPESPDEIENTYGRNACRMLTVFCFTVDVFLWMAIRQIKQEEKKENWS